MIQIYNNDSYKLIKTWPDKCVDAIVCDPPYDEQLNITNLKAHNIERLTNE